MIGTLACIPQLISSFPLYIARRCKLSSLMLLPQAVLEFPLACGISTGTPVRVGLSCLVNLLMATYVLMCTCSNKCCYNNFKGQI
jgi:hypothetical protein